MLRVNSTNFVSVQPSPKSTSPGGYFTDIVNSLNGESTVLDAQWCNDVQEEIQSVIAAGGLSPTTDQNQLLTAIETLISSAVSKYGIVGEIRDYAGTSPPSGWLFPAGQAISRTTYSALYGVIGTTFGSGDGLTTFNLPDYRGKVAAGVDNMNGTAANLITTAGSGLNGQSLGAKGGSQYTQSHNHGVTDPGHNHTVWDPGHNHGTSQSAHSHTININDPGHSHSIYGAQLRIGNSQTGSTGGYYNTVGNAPGGSTISTDTDGTGISASSVANTISISVNGNTTGIGIYGNTTGISTNNSGSGSSQNIPPTIMMNKIIFTGVF